MKPTKPQYDILTSRSAVNLFLAGQGSGKTHCAGAISAILVSNFPNAKGLIAANTYDQLNRSTMYRIREVWEETFKMSEWDEDKKIGCYVIGIQPPKHFNTENHNFDRYNNIISFDNGAVVYIGSFDNYKALDGMEIGWSILDETKDTKEEAVKEVIVGRLRQKGMYVTSDGKLTDQSNGNEPFNPLYIFSSPAKVEWINEWFELDKFEAEINEKIFSETTYFRKKHKNKFVTISSSYLNRDNLPSNYLENQKANLNSSLQDMLIYGSPFSKSGGEFYKCFNRELHTADTKYDPALGLHVSFDFNVNPYVTCLVWQIHPRPGGGNKIVLIDEICLSSPHNTTAAACAELCRRYKGHTRRTMTVYGDPSGKKADTRLEKGHNDFTIILGALREFEPRERVALSAPPVEIRGAWINTVLEKNIGELEIVIGRHCKKTIADLTYGKEAPDRTKLKEKYKDPDTGAQVEKYHHCSDAMDYFLCENFQGQFKDYQRGGVPMKITTGKNISKNSF
jgi:hypothetical protein